MLPLLLAGAKTLAKKENPKPKKVKADSLLNKSKSGGTDSSDIKKSSSIVLRSSSSISTKRISTDSFIPKKDEGVSLDASKTKKIGFEDFIQELQSINKTLDSIKDVLKNQISNKEKEGTKKRISSEKLKKKERESQLEKKKPKGAKNDPIKKPSVSFLDAIINYFTNIFLGSLAIFAIDNLPKIIGAFKDISKNFTIWSLIKAGISVLTITFRKQLRSFLRITRKLLTGPFRLIGRTISFATRQVGRLFKSIGSRVFNLIGGSVKKVLGPGLSRGLSAGARTVGSIFSRGAGRILPRAAAAVGGSGAAKVAARLGMLTTKGLKHFSKVSGIFKSIPLVGSLIGLGIDLALGVPPDEAVAGAIGSAIGTMLGGAIGKAGAFALAASTFGIGALAAPIIVAGSAGIGSFLGDWIGKQIYKNLKPNIQNLLPKQEDTEEPVLQAEGGTAGSRRSSGGVPSTAARPPSGGSNVRQPSGTGGGFTLTSHAKRRIGGDTQFLKLVRMYSSKLKVNPADLLGLMASESGLNPASDNGSHVGLIQFSKSSAASVGTSQSALKRMSRAEQMLYVYKYLRPKLSGIPGKITAGHLYTSVFLPAFTKKPANFVVASRDGTLPVGYPESRRWYSGNKGLDLNRDGKITIAELGKRVQDKKKEFGIHGGSVESGLDFPADTESVMASRLDSSGLYQEQGEMPQLFIADIRGAANQKLKSSVSATSGSPLASVSSAKPASGVAPSVSAEPSYQRPQSVIVPIPLPQQGQQSMSVSGGRGMSVPLVSGLNRGDAYREVLNVSLYKR
jgi:hypothetical protein